MENNADGAFQLNIFTGSDIHHPNKKIPSVLPWIIVSKESPYFITDQDKDWHPIGQNDAINWLDLAGLFRRRNLASVESYLRMLSDNGVTCMRLMLEYCQAEHHYFERPAGYFQPNMIRLWDDLFALCEKYRLRILLTPYDTYWMWIRWCQHPYNKKNGGLCNKRSHWLLCPEMRNLIKNRLAFASERWGGSGALFAWDLWNEIHAKHALHSVEALYEFVEDIGGFLRKKEIQIHGRAHLQTVSIFGPDINKQELVTECIFRHRALDFANIHIYEKGAIDNPKNTMDVAISAGRILRECIDEIKDNRPFFDSEHGPIHAFKDKHITLPEPFDDEYFRHFQWAHFASGGAGGGMRWANRNPHTLTNGMREAQRNLACFLPLIDWKRFNRKNLSQEIQLSNPAFICFGCGDKEQAVIWLLRTDIKSKNGMILKNAEPVDLTIKIPGLQKGHYRVIAFYTSGENKAHELEISYERAEYLSVSLPPIVTDLAIAVRLLQTL